MFDISLFGLAMQLYQSDWFQSKDATPWDCSFTAGEERDGEFERFRKSGMGSRTWYRSYCLSYVSILSSPPNCLFAYYHELLPVLPPRSWTITILPCPLHSCSKSIQASRTGGPKPYHAPSLTNLIVSPPLWATSLITGNFDFTKLRRLPQFLTRTAQPTPLSSAASSPFSSPVTSPRMESFRDLPLNSAGVAVKLDPRHRSNSAASMTSDATLTDDEDSAVSSDASTAAFDDDDIQEIQRFLGKGRERRESTPASPVMREHHFDNDGVVPIFSQWHPGECEYVTHFCITPCFEFSFIPCVCFSKSLEMHTPLAPLQHGTFAQVRFP